MLVLLLALEAYLQGQRSGSVFEESDLLARLQSQIQLLSQT